MSINHHRRSRYARPFAAGALFLLCLGIARDGDAASPFFFYKFTPIADTQGGFPYENLSGFPSINGSGRVAFRGRLTGGVEGVFTRLGNGGVNTLADTGSTEFNFGFGIVNSINSLNTVLFVGLKQTPDRVVEVLLRGEGNSATPLVSSSDNLSLFCGLQINIEKTAVFRADRADGHHVILAQGAGPLTGVVRNIAEEGSEFSSLGCSPSIGFDGTVAFTATRNGRHGIFTRAKNGTLTVIADDGGPFAAFGALALNQQGGIAFQAVRQGFGLGLFRIKNGAFVKVTDYDVGGAGDPAGFSINESGQVAFEFSFGANGSSVHLGPNSLFGRLIGTGNVMFGRRVAFVHIDRDALNSTGQIAVWIIFDNGTEMIARGDPVRFPDTVLATGALQVATGAGGSVTVTTPIATPPVHATLSFDVEFLTADGELSVKLGDKVLKSIAASDPGVRRRVSIPIDMRAIAKEQRLGHVASLQFVLAGKTGASAQIADVVIPGLLADRIESAAFSRWHVDTSAGGSAAAVSTARLPVKIRLSQPEAPKSEPNVVTVAVLSTKDFDASTDIERSSLRLAGSPVRTTRDKEGKEQPACDARDVNNDKIKDLVCEVEVARAGPSKRDEKLRLEAMTQFGWGIAGSDVLHVGKSPYTK
jgi:hypothetical protein